MAVESDGVGCKIRSFAGASRKLRRSQRMKTKLKMIYWKGKKFWIGKLVDHPEIMTQGETVEELEENLKDAYQLMVMDDVPEEHLIKPIAIST